MTLRCGVPRPLVLTRGCTHDNPWSATVEINGVEWIPEQPVADRQWARTTRA
ncbi:hypothetical protein ACH4U6_31205 [Streptomyces netropsis]|uniref:hypothetical protein n=1 Tax=Streptomyces netropsis TaxID=55404 RepID=UPI0037AF7A31